MSSGKSLSPSQIYFCYGSTQLRKMLRQAQMRLLAFQHLGQQSCLYRGMYVCGGGRGIPTMFYAIPPRDKHLGGSCPQNRLAETRREECHEYVTHCKVTNICIQSVCAFHHLWWQVWFISINWFLSAKNRLKDYSVIIFKSRDLWHPVVVYSML